MFACFGSFDVVPEPAEHATEELPHQLPPQYQPTAEPPKYTDAECHECKSDGHLCVCALNAKGPSVCRAKTHLCICVLKRTNCRSKTHLCCCPLE